MAFFAESAVQESYQDLGIVVNEYTDFDMFAMEACDTIQEMDNAILFGIGRYELAQVREGAEVVYTEGMLTTIKDKLAKIWNFIKNWVKSVWNKFVAWIASYVRGDKAFLSKYKKKIQENVIYLDKDFELKLKAGKYIDDAKALDSFNESGLSALVTAENIINGLSETESVEAINKKVEDTIETLDDKFDDLKSDTKDADLEKEVDGAWVRSNLNKILEILAEDVNKIKRNMEKIDKKIDDSYKKNIKTAEDAAKKMDNTDQRASATAIVTGLKQYASRSSKIYSHLTSFTIKMEKQKRSDARAICRKILTAKPNPKYNESAFEHNDFESYFNI